MKYNDATRGTDDQTDDHVRARNSILSRGDAIKDTARKAFLGTEPGSVAAIAIRLASSTLNTTP